MAKSTEPDLTRIAEAQQLIDDLFEKRRQEKESRKAWWDKYYEQLAKASPFQGGAKKAPRNGRIFRWDDL